MTTATQNGWTPYSGQFLGCGDEVKIVSYAGRGIGGGVGIVERRLQKNIAVIINGRRWRIPPELIDCSRTGDPSNLPEIEKAVVKCDPNGLKDCEVGDVILMWRGKFDVVKIVSLTATTVRCRVVAGRGAGKVYGYKPEWFVQKLDKTRIAS